MFLQVPDEKRNQSPAKEQLEVPAMTARKLSYGALSHLHHVHSPVHAMSIKSMSIKLVHPLFYNTDEKTPV